MEIKNILEGVTDSGLRELLNLFLSEWMSKISREQEKENPQKYKAVNERFQNWEELIKKGYPELAEMNREFLDWLVGYYGEELENHYLCGVCDGIRVLKWMISL